MDCSDSTTLECEGARVKVPNCPTRSEVKRRADSNASEGDQVPGRIGYAASSSFVRSERARRHWTSSRGNGDEAYGLYEIC